MGIESGFHDTFERLNAARRELILDYPSCLPKLTPMCLARTRGRYLYACRQTR